MRQIQSLILVTNELIQSAVFFENIEIIEAGDQQDISDTQTHEILETLETGTIPMLDPHGVGMR
jgi:hypothetical protein